MATVCSICGKKLGMLAMKYSLSDGIICGACYGKVEPYGTTGSSSSCSISKFKEWIEIEEKNQAVIDNFQATSHAGEILLDDNAEMFVVNGRASGKARLYRYDQLVDFELLEDGESISKGGLGRAVVGGVLFGGLGAVVGGVTGGKKTKKICKSLKIKITLRDGPRLAEYISFIKTETKTDGFVYRISYQSAQDTLSALQLIADKLKSKAAAIESTEHQAVSGADEIMKYKGLLDAGIITEEEFTAKKAQILGL